MNDLRASIDRALQDHITTSDDGRCTCGHTLPFFGHTLDRHREHVAAEIAEAVADLLATDGVREVLGWETDQ